MQKIQKITERIFPINQAEGFTVMGDPGCDGMGTEILSLYAQALQAAKGNFCVVAGDIVPTGTDRFYHQINELTELAAHAPVYFLRGNHDTGKYQENYGFAEYAFYQDKTLFVVLDNSDDTFTPASLQVLETAVQQYARPDVVLMMHIPPPNAITDKAVSRQEWEKVQRIIDGSPCAGRVRYIIAGHVHSYFEDEAQGAKIIVTGGAGARIATMPKVETPYNHYMEFFYDGDRLCHRKVDLAWTGDKLVENQETQGNLHSAFLGECEAYVKYLLYAEDAQKHGLAELSTLFSTAAAAELIHAKSFFYSMGGMGSSVEQVQDAANREHQEAEQDYPRAYQQALEAGEGLAAEAFRDAGEAEKTHEKLFRAALPTLERGEDLPKEQYYTCTSCGYTFAGTKRPDRCPVCGAPYDKIRQEN